MTMKEACLSQPEQKKARGFQTMDAERRSEISSLGGRTAHQNGLGHEFDSESASKAAQARWAKHRAKQQKALESI